MTKVDTNPKSEIDKILFYKINLTFHLSLYTEMSLISVIIAIKMNNINTPQITTPLPSFTSLITEIHEQLEVYTDIDTNYHRKPSTVSFETYFIKNKKPIFSILRGISPEGAKSELSKYASILENLTHGNCHFEHENIERYALKEQFVLHFYVQCLHEKVDYLNEASKIVDEIKSRVDKGIASRDYEGRLLDGDHPFIKNAFWYNSRKDSQVLRNSLRSVTEIDSMRVATEKLSSIQNELASAFVDISMGFPVVSADDKRYEEILVTMEDILRDIEGNLQAVKNKLALSKGKIPNNS